MPASSITFQAFRSCTSSARPVEENPAGLRKVEPAERSFVGCEASRRAICSSIRWASAAGSPASARNRAETITAPSGRVLER